MKSLQTKMLVFFSSIFIISTVFMSITIYQSSTNLVVDSISTQAKLIAEKVVSIIDLDQYEKISIETGQTDYYYELREKLNTLKEMNGLRYLYTINRRATENGKYEYYYVADGYPINSNDASELGEVEENEYPTLISAFETKETQIGELSYNEEYGATVTAYVPIINNNGEIIGVVGADFNGDQIYELLNKEKLSTIVLTVIVLVILVLAIYFIARMINRPLKQLILEMRKVKTGDFTVQLETTRRDEIGQLMNAFNDMVKNVEGMIQTINQSTRKLSLSTEDISSAAENNSAITESFTEAIQDIMRGSNRQLEININALDIIKGMSKEIQLISNNISAVSSSSERASEVSNDGKMLLNNAVEQMEQIKNSHSHSSKVIKDLGNKSNEINEIVEMITDIAGQTNLLALNAAIEAARAGEHGKGFAVVSEEVRKLAEQSGNAASRIGIIVKDIQSKTNDAISQMENSNIEVEKGTSVMIRTRSIFNNINEAIQIVAQQIEMVNESINQLSNGSTKMVEVVDEVYKIAKHSSNKTTEFVELTENQLSLTEEVYASIDELRHMAQQLETMVGQFKVD